MRCPHCLTWWAGGLRPTHRAAKLPAERSEVSRCRGAAAATLKARSARKHSGIPLTLPWPQPRGVTPGALPFPAAPRLTSLDTNSSLLQDQPSVLFTYWESGGGSGSSLLLLGKGWGSQTDAFTWSLRCRCVGGKMCPPQVPGQTLSPAQAPDLQKKPCLFCNFGGVWAGVELGLSFQSALSTGKIHLTSQPTPVTCLWRLNKWIDSHELPPHPQHAGSWS